MAPVLTASARGVLSRRVRIDYTLLPGMRVPIGLWTEELEKREFITQVEITYSIAGHTIVIPAGYIFDAASIPRIFWGLEGFDPIGTKLWAALIHDWLCDEWAKYQVALDQLQPQLAACQTVAGQQELLATLPSVLSPVVADAIFVAVLLDTGEVTWRAIVMYLAVLGHHTFPQASLYIRRGITWAAYSGAGGVASAGALWIWQNVL